MLAEHVLGGAHADDRLVLAAVRAVRDQLIAPQAVDAAKAAGQLSRAQPRLTATRANRALKRSSSPFRGHGLSAPLARRARPPRGAAGR